MDNLSVQLINFYVIQDLFHYVIAMKDKNIFKISSKYCYDILAAFELLH